MESHRRIGGFRTLLPFEVKLCESIGITDKEYFEFLDLIEAKPVEADIVNMPAALPAWMVVTNAAGAVTALSFWGSVAVSVALAAASYLLTPKPKEQSQGARLDIGGVQGRSRFNPSHGFDSLQDLASLGSLIPLVYARRGVRVRSQLLWSQIRTVQYGQEINAICLFSNGELGSKPKFESFALGEIFLTNIPKTKLQLYFSRGERNNNRLNFLDKYSEGTSVETNNYLNRGSREYDTNDPFSIKTFTQFDFFNNPQYRYNASFSSTKTPSTSTQFGLFSPMPNGNAYKLNWELILLMKDGDDGIKKDQRIKMGKLAHYYPRYVGIMASADSTHYTGAWNGLTLSPSQVQEAIDNPQGPLLVNYRIYHDNNEAAWIDSSIIEADSSKKWNKFSPWGSSDAKAVADTTREGVDDGIKLGDQYMVGSTLMTVIREDHGGIWTSEPTSEGGFQKAITLQADEGGYLEFRDTDVTAKPYESLVVQKAKLATFVNTRESDITEIGIKSTVWRQINGYPNVNEMPSQDRLRSYETTNGSIQLGSVSKYVRRASFFKLQARKINSTDPFVDISSKIMCVEGSVPTAQYNTIYIKHDYTSKYEFRFMPVAGNVVLNKHADRQVHVLNYTSQLQYHKNNSLDLAISYHAIVKTLPNLASIHDGNRFTNNKEWDRGGLGLARDQAGNVILGAPVDSFQPVESGSNNFTGTQTVDITDILFPDFYETYQGYGPNDVYGTWTNVTQRNFKGTPREGNAYYSNWHSVGVVSFPYIEDGQNKWRWTFYGGNRWIPTGSLDPIVTYGAKPDWTKWVEGQDIFGNPDGVLRRFKVAKNPAGSSYPNEDDLRASNYQGRVFYYAIWIQKQQKVQPTETTDIRGTTPTKGNGSGLTVQVLTRSDSSATYKTFQMVSPGDGYFDGDTVTVNDEPTIPELRITGKIKPVVLAPSGGIHDDWSEEGTLQYYQNYWGIGAGTTPSHNPNNVVADYFLYSSEASSHENGAEHEIAFINEIIDNGNLNGQINYEKLAIGGIRVGATGSINSFNSFSAFIEQGIKVDRLITDSNVGIPNRNAPADYESSDNFVEIAHDLLTNKEYGAGDLVGHDGVDRQSMIEGAKYCKANGFYWNGIIDNKFNLREFIFEHAAYNFLDFSILGGRFSLKPSFPIKDDYTINYDATVENGIDIKALFTDGNMRNIKVTMLTPEERTMFKATVMYRNDKVNSKGVAAFPETIAKTYAYNHDFPSTSMAEFLAEAPNLPEEVFDLSNWCTSLEHAKAFAAIALALRKGVDHGIVFETIPSSVFGLIAGDHIRVVTESTHTSRFNNGSIDEDGVVISRSPISGSINVYVWSPGTLGGVESKEFSVNSNGVNSAGLKNKLFAQVDQTEEDRIYKVESITYGEEGFIQIAASHVPINSQDKLNVLAHSDPSNETAFNTYFPELLK